MKIVIDCRSLRKKPAGVPNFIIPAINCLAVQKKDWTFYLLSNQEFNSQVEDRIQYHPNVIKIISPFWIFPRIALIWYFFKLPFLVKKLQADILYTPIPNLPPWLPGKTKSMITVHDMVYKRFASTMSKGNLFINNLLHDRSINRAHYIWSVSQFTKHEIEDLFPNRYCKDIFVGSSVDKNLFRHRAMSETDKSILRKKYQLTDRFILFVGTLEPRKNLSFLISLMPELIGQGFSLLIVGAKGWGADNDQAVAAPESILSGAVKFSGFISTEELVNIYSAADAYVSTALNEGFGLPQLEAMCCGCPVISPHNSAMIEIVNGAGETIKGWDKQEWINTILKVCNDREHYISRGLQRATEFEWPVVIEGLIRYISSKTNQKLQK